MTLTDIQVRLLSIIEARNAAQERAAAAERTGQYFTLAECRGYIDGLQAAIDGFSGIEPIKSLEYLATKPEAAESRFPLEAWKV